MVRLGNERSAPAGAEVELLQTWWAHPDIRSLIIGVAGGFVVLAIVGVARLALAVGPAGFRSFRQASAKSDLDLVLRIGDDKLNWVGWMAYLTLVQIAVAILFCGLAAFALVARDALAFPVAASTIVISSATSILGFTGAAVVHGRLAIEALANYPRLVGRLRTKAGLPSEAEAEEAQPLKPPPPASPRRARPA